MDHLDMIPVIVWSRKVGKEWKKRETPHLADLEYTDEDEVSLNVLGAEYDYQIQIRISSLKKLWEKAIPDSEL